jgi:hypothetical protein
VANARTKAEKLYYLGAGVERGGPAFLDRGISGFVAGPNRRNQVHEEATT